MRQKTEHELRKAQLLKTVRTMLRLKASLQADEWINELAPRFEADFDRAITEGKSYELAATNILRDAEDEDFV